MNSKFQTIVLNSSKTVNSIEEINKIVKDKLKDLPLVNQTNSRIVNGNDKNSISIKELEGVQEWAFSKSDEDTIKYLIIVPFEKLSEEGQNSLLKIVEEPPQYMQVILITHNIDLILKTILSRSIVIHSDEIGGEVVNIEIDQLILRFIESDFLLRKEIIEKELGSESYSRYQLNLFTQKLMKLLLERNFNPEIFYVLRKVHSAIKRGANTKLALDYLNIAFERLIG